MPQSRQKTRRHDLSSARRLRMKSFRLNEWSLKDSFSLDRYLKKQEDPKLLGDREIMISMCFFQSVVLERFVLARRS